jgi:GH25 family lysozyme M1 (1,4-beta-N-acetylmuramidase)
VTHLLDLIRTRSGTAAGSFLTAVVTGAVLLGSALPGSAHVDSHSSPAGVGVEQDNAETDHAGSGLAGRTAAGVAPLAAATLRGLDVSGFQGDVNWSSVASAGASFAYVKATEGINYTNGHFAQQYNGSAGVGLIRGAYHFARPNASSGSSQADYFVNHGGGWSRDGKTLPGALDIEYQPSGDTCYGLSRSSMVSWIRSFVTEYHSRTGRYPMIYSTTDWWTTCTGNYSGFAGNDPLWIANYTGKATPLPAGWSGYTIWQHAAAGTFPGDQDVFNGTLADLRTFALGDYTPPPPPGGGWPTVQQGQSGRQVTTVQYLLNAHGSALTADGQFGAGTRSAVVSFQSSKGLTADGIVGANTWQVLIITVREGSTGPAVQAVQAELNAHGSTLTVDGQFGAGTQSAVVSFQSSKGLTADGIVGPSTWQALVS